MNSQRIMIILFVCLLIGVSTIYILEKTNKENEFYSSLADIIATEAKTTFINKRIQELLQEENDLYYVIISVGKEEKNMADSLAQVNRIIDETSELFSELAQKVKTTKQNIMILRADGERLKDKEEQEKAHQIIFILENRYSMLNEMEISYKRLSKEQQNLYKHLGERVVNFPTIDQILDKIEEERKNFNYYSNRYDKFGKELNQVSK